MRRLIALAFVAFACSMVGGLGAPTSALGASPGTTYDLTSITTPFPQATGRFGERHAATTDIDGDGVNDYFVAAPSEDVGTSDAGRVYAVSGRTRNVIYTLLSPEPQSSAKFGFAISVLGDVDGDGTKDLAVGTNAQDTTVQGAPCTPPAAGCNLNQGKAWVFSGARGGLLYSVNNPDPQTDGRFGSRIGRAGDVNGDGVPESIIGASNNDVPADCGQVTPVPPTCHRDQGQAYIFDGKTGSLVRALNLPPTDQVDGCPPTTCGSFGVSVQSPGDVDADGTQDQLVSASTLSVTSQGAPCTSGSFGCNGGQGAMYLFSGDEGGRLLARVDDPVPQAGASFGFQDAAPLAPGDVNHDGRADIFGNGFTQTGSAGTDAGRAWVFDGKATVENPAERGRVLYEPKDPTPTEGGQFAFSLDRTDYNKDGTPDLYLGQSPQRNSTDQSGGTYLFDGRDGSLLKALELPSDVAQRGSAGNLGSNLGRSVAAPGDLNGDGEPDYLAGAPFQDVGANQDQGQAFAFLSKVTPQDPPGALPPTSGGAPAPPTGLGPPVPPKTTDDPGNGGPVSDSYIRNLLGSINVNAEFGRGVDGSVVPRSKCTIVGTSKADRIIGTKGNDVICALGGNDRVDGRGGKDVIDTANGNDVASGGAGNDALIGVRGRDRLNGNSGNDRIGGGRSGDRLSGSSGKDRIYGGSSNDRINGNSGNDRINSRDRRRDRVNGGSGRDRAVVDRRGRRGVSAKRADRVRRVERVR